MALLSLAPVGMALLWLFRYPILLTTSSRGDIQREFCSLHIWILVEVNIRVSVRDGDRAINRLSARAKVMVRLQLG